MLATYKFISLAQTSFFSPLTLKYPTTYVSKPAQPKQAPVESLAFLSSLFPSLWFSCLLTPVLFLGYSHLPNLFLFFLHTSSPSTKKLFLISFLPTPQVRVCRPSTMLSVALPCGIAMIVYILSLSLGAS